MGAEEGTLRSAYDLTDMAEGENVDKFTAKQLGNLGELIAASYLDHRGYEVLEQGYRCPEGEADLIAYDPDEDVIVLVEVKTRRVHEPCSAEPEAAVDRRKRERYRRIASCYLMDRFPILSLRFDVIGISVTSETEAIIEHYFDVFAWEADR